MDQEPSMMASRFRLICVDWRKQAESPRFGSSRQEKCSGRLELSADYTDFRRL